MNKEVKVLNSVTAIKVKAEELIDYQADAVVSKTLIARPGGTVTLFAFDQGQGLSEHTAPFDALVSVINGEAEIIISGQPYILQAGEMIIMPADEPHALNAIKRFKMILTMIKS
ncbi:MAG TPA: cupin domain-containing protein [Gelria sp.]|jgi:quercetin dioxygenase-like cupin family protein|nr:cupin domain-containing protein [Gelria sp.]